MRNDLLNLGLIPRKSQIIDLPTKEQVPEHLMHHFVRGYLDGDGCIYSFKSNCNVSICVSKIMGLTMKKLIKEVLNINSAVRYSPGIYNLDISGRTQCLKFLDWIYEDATIYLDRKHEKYLAMKNYVYINAKLYQIIFNNGVEIKITNLTKWAKQNNFLISRVRSIFKGKSFYDIKTIKKN